ncbi:MAG TPA: carboxypeptidase-like regulatory domain-containing protein [Verrucomicrobiae bacterium]|nr:carboxypeptidase-like regulatory domain-containing protein [Verrucomicrobiae bacterium]
MSTARSFRPFFHVAIRFLACVLLFSSTRVFAQVESGTFVGTVRDASGAVIAGASVTVVEIQTNVVHKASTNEQGEYNVNHLNPGIYSVSIEQAGFKTATQSNIKLDINQVVRVDVTLVPGVVSEHVEVSAAEPLVESQTSSIGQVIEDTQVHELPLNGRNFVQLAYLSPGVNEGEAGAVQQGGIPENERANGSIKVNGLMATNNNFLLNGFDNNEQQIGFEVLQPPVEAIDEFKVQTSNFGADIGKGGAVVNVVIKSGTNNFHGTAFEFLRNSYMDAKNFFDSPTSPIPPFKQNQFGGTLGGPIIKNKTFFFVDYQGTRVRESQTFISTVPTAAERTGDFSDQLGTGPNGAITGQIYDPLTTNQATNQRTPFPGNVILPCVNGTRRSATGGSCLDPAALNVINLFPLPNIAGAGSANNYLYNPVASNDQDAFDIRIDHQWRSDTITGTFSFGNVESQQPDPFPGEAGGGSFSGNVNNKAYVVGISDVHSFSSTKTNELKIGYTRYSVNAIPFFENEDLATQLGIPGINVPGDPYTNGLPNIMIAGYSALGNQDWFPEILKENNYQLKDSLTWIHGRHSFKMGGDLIRRQHGFFQTQNPRGDFTFDQQFTENLNDTVDDPGDALATFLIGNPIYSFRDGLQGDFGMSWWEVSGYFMDDFRVSTKLTLNLGLRYDLFTPMVEQHDRIANFNFANGEFVAPGQPGVSDTGNVQTNYKNFAPRIGFAYTPFNDAKTVVRGGYGIFYSLQADQNDAELAYNPTGFFSSQTVQFNANSIPVLQLSTGFVTPSDPSGSLPPSSLSDPSGRASAIPFHNPTPSIQEWNLNVERQLFKDAVLQVAYVGVHGVHLTYLRNLNQALQPLDSNFEVCPVPTDPYCADGLPSNYGRPYYNTVPQIAAIRTSNNDASLSSNALQVRFEKRFSAGWTLLASYTYQHSLGVADEDEVVGPEPQNTYDMKAERGDVPPDFRNSFTAAWTYELPFGPGKRYLTSNGPAHWFSAGWQLNGIVSMYSGQAFTPLLSYDDTNTGSGGARPNIYGNPYNFSNAASAGCPSNSQTLQCWYNPAAFGQINSTTFLYPALAPGQTFAREYGDAGPGILRGPAQYNVDFSIFKSFQFKEALNMELRGEVFNLFNTPQFAPPNSTVDIPGLSGSISSTVHSSRQLQIALRFVF